MIKKIYHIYANEKCLFHSISEEEFPIIWKTLNQLADLMNTNYKPDDLDYEELILNQETILNSSH